MAKAKQKGVEEMLDQVLPAIEAATPAPGGAGGGGGEARPSMHSREWTAYVMKRFDDDELYDGNPTFSGLRRLTEELVGRVVESVSVVNQAPNPQNNRTSCVTHHLTVHGHDGTVLKKSGVADVFDGNGDDLTFSWRYSAATCETRAKARAYREMLMLTDVCAAEEISPVPEDQSGMSGQINDRHINFLALWCGRLDINPEKFANSGKGKYERVRDISYDTAIQMSTKINEYQRNPATIPADIRGFKDGKAWLGA